MSRPRVANHPASAANSLAAATDSLAAAAIPQIRITCSSDTIAGCAAFHPSSESNHARV